ncbi:hypothetical protein ACLOJK_037578 [Asimina triloba]
MLTVLAFGFMPGGGFALSDYRSFDPFIHVPASMARQTYSYVGYSPTIITLAAEGNWSTLAAATSTSPFAHKVLISTPLSFHKIVSVVAALSAPRPSRKSATIAAASSAPRSSCKAATSISQSARKTAAAASAVSSASGRIKRRSRKVGPASRRTTRLNR